MSLAIAMSILRRFCDCASASELNLMRPSLVTPSTSAATSSPNRSRTSLRLAELSSTTSCRSAAWSVAVSRLSSARIMATSSGWLMNGSPDLRIWPCVMLEGERVRLLDARQIGRGVVGADLRLDTFERHRHERPSCLHSLLAGVVWAG